MSDAPRIPDGYQELLEELSYEVLKQRPADFIQFSIDFLNARKGPNGTFITKRTQSGFASADPLGNNRNLHINSCPDAGQNQNHFICSGSEKCRCYCPKRFHPEKAILAYQIKKERLGHFIEKHPMFQAFDECDFNRMINSMILIDVCVGEVIINLGDKADNFYIVDEGKFSITIMKDGRLREIGVFDNFGCFGELELLYEAPREATIKAETDGSLWVMSGQRFKDIIQRIAIPQRQIIEECFAKTTILKKLSLYQRSELADCLICKTFDKDDIIVTEGEDGNEMYFICKGTAKVTRKKEHGIEEITTLTDGDFFGEMAIIKEQKRSATVTASTELQLAILEANSFKGLLGPCLEDFQLRMENYQ